MPNNIQTIIDKFDKEFSNLITTGDNNKYTIRRVNAKYEPDNIKQFLKDSLTSMLEIPYNVSEWARVGKERGYWDYFRDEIRKKDEEELIKMLPPEKKLKEYEETDPNVLTEANLRNLKVSFENQAISPYVSAHNEILKEFKQIIKLLVN